MDFSDHKNSQDNEGRPVLKIVGDFLSTFITTLVVIIAILLVMIKVSGCSLYSVDSYSMSPKYPINSLIVVRSVDPEDISVGDVITYLTGDDGITVTHRVTEVDTENGTFTTKGDANDIEDASPVLWDNVVGRVVFGIPFFGTPLRILTAEGNRAAVIAVIAALFILSVMWDIVSGRGRKKENPDDKK